MIIKNMYQAKTDLSVLVDQALRGEEVIIAKAGEPMVRLVPFIKKKAVRKPGSWKGKGWIAENFDDTDPEIEAAFYDSKI